MERRTRPVNGGVWFEDYFWPPLVTYFVILLIVFLGALTVFSIGKGVRNSHVKHHRALAKLFYSYGPQLNDNSPVMRAKRRKIAWEILAVKSRYENVAGEHPINFSKQHIKEIQITAQTGAPMHFAVTRMSYGPFWKFFSWYVLLGIFSVLGAFFLINYYVFEEGDFSFHLADLPWRNKVWPWIFTATLGPLGWLVMAISAVLLSFEPPVQLPTVEVEDLPEAEEEDAEETGGQEPSEEENPRRNPKKTYLHSPQAALALYLQLRTEAAEEFRKRRLEELQDEIDGIRRWIRDYTSKLKGRQRELNGYQAEMQVLQQGLDEGSFAEDPNKLREEFDRLAKLPGVLAMQVINDRIRLIVRASIEYEGVLYDKGDWQIDFGAETMEIRASELRTGVRHGWSHGHYPDYRYGDGTYCFGDRYSEIGQHFAKGQYLEAIALAVECLNSVNREDQQSIPNAFKEVPEVENTEPRRSVAAGA